MNELIRSILHNSPWWLPWAVVSSAMFCVVIYVACRVFCTPSEKSKRRKQKKNRDEKLRTEIKPKKTKKVKPTVEPVSESFASGENQVADSNGSISDQEWTVVGKKPVDVQRTEELLPALKNVKALEKSVRNRKKKNNVGSIVPNMSTQSTPAVTGNIKLQPEDSEEEEWQEQRFSRKGRQRHSNK